MLCCKTINIKTKNESQETKAIQINLLAMCKKNKTICILLPYQSIDIREGCLE
jgi:hypothetical protein